MNWIKTAYTCKPSKEDKGKVSVWAIINILFHKQINKTSPSKPKPRAKVQAHTCNPSLWDVKFTRDHPQLSTKFEASLAYMRPCLKNEIK